MLRLRLLVLLAVSSSAIVAVIPTFCPGWDVPFLGNEQRIHLGAELQGGTELLLEVETEVGLAAEVKADAAYLQSKVGEAGLFGAEVRPVAGFGIEISSQAEPREVLVFVEARLGSYDYDGSADGVHRFTLSKRWQGDYRETAARRTLEEIDERIREMCVEGSTLERRDSRIYVSLPGWFGGEANCR